MKDYLFKLADAGQMAQAASKIREIIGSKYFGLRVEVYNHSEVSGIGVSSKACDPELIFARSRLVAALLDIADYYEGSALAIVKEIQL